MIRSLPVWCTSSASLSCSAFTRCAFILVCSLRDLFSLREKAARAQARSLKNQIDRYLPPSSLQYLSLYNKFVSPSAAATMAFARFFGRRRNKNDLPPPPVPPPPTAPPPPPPPSPSPLASDADNSYPYGLPSPPKAWLFGGLGYGYGIGCSAGPVFGVGVGISPAGVQFGAGVCPVGVFCGAGLAAGFIAGQGSAYVPYGAETSFFLTPRFVMLERYAELYRARARRRRERSHPRRDRAMESMWPRPLRNLFRDVQDVLSTKRADDGKVESGIGAGDQGAGVNGVQGGVVVPSSR